MIGGRPLCRGDVGPALGDTGNTLFVQQMIRTDSKYFKMLDVFLAGVRCWRNDCASPDLRLS